MPCNSCNYSNECNECNAHRNYTEGSFEKCGLYCFLKTIDEELKTHSNEKELINTLRNDYLNAWRSCPDIRGNS